MYFLLFLCFFENVWTPSATIFQIARLANPIQDGEEETKATLEGMITSLIETLELQNFRHMTTSTMQLESVLKFCCWRHGQELSRNDLYFKIPFFKEGLE